MEQSNLNKIPVTYLAMLLFCVALSVYYPSIFADVNSVDDTRMMNQLLNMDDFSLYDVFVPGGNGYYYRPLLWVTFIFDRFAWFLQASFMHLENMLLHAANGILVFLAARRIARYVELNSDCPPFLAALVFVLHPVNTEPVNWISGRTDLLAGFFIFLSTLFVMRAVEKDTVSDSFLAAFFFFLATLAKDNAVFFFPGALFMVYCCRRSIQSYVAGLFCTKCLYAAITLVPLLYFSIRHLAFKANDSGIGLAVKGIAGGDRGLLDKLRIMFKAFGFYAKKIIQPFPLNFAIQQISGWYVLVGVVAVCVILFFAYRRSILGALLFTSACVLAPALLVPLGKMAWTPLAERYLYISSAFFSIALVFGIWKMALSYRGLVPVTIVAAMFLLPVMAYSVYARTIVWQSNLTLFRDTVTKSPDFAPAKNELAGALQKIGKHEEATKIVLNNTLPQSDKYSIVTDLSKISILLSKKDYKSAAKILDERKCDQSSPLFKDCTEAFIRLNNTIIDQHNLPGTFARKLYLENIEYVKQIQNNTGDPFYYYRIGQMYLGVKDKKKAAEYFKYAAERSPDGAYYKEPARKMARKFAVEN